MKTNRTMAIRIGAMALVCALSFGGVSALAASNGTQSANGYARPQMTDAQKSEMETMKAEREAKEAAFIATLTTEQKALYEAMKPVKPVDGESFVKSAKPDEAAMAEMKAKQEAFIASLTESQKTAYDELFARKGHQELSETQKADMETMKAEREAKEAAFIATLTTEQKALYEAMRPVKQANEENFAKQDESAMADRKAKQEAFINSLTEEQKAAYENLGGMKFGQQIPSRLQG